MFLHRRKHGSLSTGLRKSNSKCAQALVLPVLMALIIVRVTHGCQWRRVHDDPPLSPAGEPHVGSLAPIAHYPRAHTRVTVRQKWAALTMFALRIISRRRLSSHMLQYTHIWASLRQAKGSKPSQARKAFRANTPIPTEPLASD